MTERPSRDLIARSNRLGADPRNTNYAGGNTSAKGTETDPVTGRAGGADVGEGLRRRPGHADREEPGGAAAGPAARPGRRLPGRGARGRDGRRVRLLPARQGRRRAVDRHRDARPGRRRRTSTTCTPTPGSRWPPPRTGRSSPRSASATGWCGCRGGAPASSSAWTSPRSRRRTRRPSACILGGHGITAWGDTQRGGRGELAGDHPHRARQFLAEHGSAEPFGAGRARLRAAARGGAAGQGRRDLPDDPRARLHRPPAGRALHRQRRRAGVPGPGEARRRWPSWAPPARTTSCAPRSSRWSSTCPATASRGGDHRPAAGAARGLPGGLPGLLRPQRHPGLARRCAARTRRSCWCPGWGCSPSARTSRPPGWPGEFYVNAINVMRGAESVSTYAPITRGGEVPHRVLGAGGGQARADARSPSRWPPGSRWSPAPASGIGKAIAHAARRRGRLRRRRRPEPGQRPAGRRRARRRRTSRSRCKVDVSDEDAVAAALAAARAGVRRGRPGGQQRRAVALQAAAGDHRRGLGPAARRDGQGLVPGLPGGGAGDDRAGAGRRHRLHLQQELACSPARTTSPTPPPRPTRPTRSGCWPPSSGQHGIRVNGINPDGVVRGSGIFAGGWGAKRAEVYGVKEEDLGAYYAKRTLLGQEVLPEHVADAVFALTGGDLSQTTGLHIPVDSGVAAAFLR